MTYKRSDLDRPAAGATMIEVQVGGRRRSPGSACGASGPASAGAQFAASALWSRLRDCRQEQGVSGPESPVVTPKWRGEPNIPPA